MSSLRLVLAAAVLLMAACIHQRDRAATTDDEPTPEALPPTPVTASVELVEIEGMTREKASQWLAPTRQPLSACRPTEPGLMHIAIISDSGGTLMELSGETAFDAATRGCILSALSLYDEELLDRAILNPSTLPARGDATEQPTAVTSLVTISW